VPTSARTGAKVVRPFSNDDGEKFHMFITFAEATSEAIEVLSFYFRAIQPTQRFFRLYDI
jgi:hypothetical protein